jgi:hypothetical protein
MLSQTELHKVLMKTETSVFFAQNCFIPLAGGTISSVGRYVRKYGLNTTIVFGDTQYSGYYDWVLHGKFGENDTTAPSNWVKPGISGVGYGYDGSFIQGRTTRCAN